MEQRDEELMEALLPQNSELKDAYENHRALKSKVDALQAKPVLTADEDIAKKNLQKRKLAEKDKIMRILANYRRAQASRQSA